MAEAAAAPVRWGALAVCIAAGFVTTLDVSIVNVAIPSVEQSLAAGPGQLQLIVGGYALALGITLVPAGRLGDARGRRRMLITGLVIFAITSLAAGLAPSASLLAAARLAQGVGAGLVQPQTFGFIQQLFRGQERGRAFGVFGATMGLANALGPVVGGLIITVGGPANGWRWVFGINLPIIAVVIVFALRLLQDPITLRTNLTVRRQSFRPELDPVGLLLITGAALTFMMPFMTTSGTQGALRWGWLGVSAVLALALLRWEPRYQLRTGEAVLDPALLGDESFRSGVLLGMIYFAGFTPVFLVVSLFLQSDLGFGALRAGLVTAPWAAVAAIDYVS